MSRIIDRNISCLGIAVLIDVFILWVITKEFYFLWPGCRVRPMGLPALCVSAWVISATLCVPFCATMFRRRRYVLMGLGILLATLPILLGYWTFFHFHNKLGFIYSE